MTDEVEVAAPSAAPEPVAVPDDAAARLDRAIAGWMADEIHNSPVARSTDAYNHLVTTLPALKARILQEI